MAEYRIAAAIALLAAAFAAGWKTNGWRLGNELAELRLSIESARVESAQKARRIETLSADLARANGELFIVAERLRRAEQDKVRREVSEYEETRKGSACVLPVSWVRIDTAAALGLPADGTAPSGVDDAPSGVTDIEALKVSVERSYVCRNEIDKLAALQDYVRQQLETINGG